LRGSADSAAWHIWTPALICPLSLAMQYAR